MRTNYTRLGVGILGTGILGNWAEDCQGMVFNDQKLFDKKKLSLYNHIGFKNIGNLTIDHNQGALVVPAYFSGTAFPPDGKAQRRSRFKSGAVPQL